MTAVSTSSSLFYDRSATAMGALSTQAAKLGDQISTGKKAQAPSDDPVAYQRLQGMAVQTADATADAANVATAQSLLSQADTTLGSMATQLQRANELVIQARSGTLPESGPKAIAEELSGIADTLVSLAGTTDQRGQALLGGGDGAAAVTTNADGTHTLASVPQPTIPIGGGQSVQPAETATKVLGLSGGGNIVDLLKSLAATLSSGGSVSDDAMNQVQDANQQVSDVQASLGARAARVDLAATQITDASTNREAARSSLEDTDTTAAITELQKTMTVLQATQASFTKLSSLSLFDYLK